MNENITVDFVHHLNYKQFFCFFIAIRIRRQLQRLLV